MESNDHDLLIELNTKVGILIQQQSAFMTASQNAMTGLSERVTALETKDSRDSEKVQAISRDVQRSLENHTRITTLESEMDTLKEGMKSVTQKSNVWDIVNSIGVTLAGVVAYFK